MRLQLVVVVLVAWHLRLDTLPLPHVGDDLARHGGGVERAATWEHLPVVEHGLREGLATGVGRQVGVDGEQRGTRALGLLEDVTTSPGQHTVDTTHGLLRHLDLDQEDRLHETRVGKESRSVEHTTSGGDDLATTTVDGIGVEGNIHDVEADGTHRLLGNGTFLGSPLETRDDGVLDFVQVLDSLGLVNQQVGAVRVRTEAPNLTGIGNVPAVLVSQDTGTSLEIVTRADLAVLDILAHLLSQGLGSEVDTVVLVGRLGQSSHAGLASNGLTVLHNRVGDTERHTGVVLLQILQADLQVQLTSTSNNVLTRLVDVGQYARVRLGQTLETFDQLRQIVGVLDPNGALHDRRDRELHDSHVVGGLGGAQGTRLEQELVNTDQTENVTGWHVLDGLGVATPHQDGTLDGLDEQVLLLARDVVRALNANLDTRAGGTREDTTESVETALVRGRHHLGDVDHERTLVVTVTDTDGALIVRPH